ncbi:MAG: 2-oxoacid:acceptor oxidoreductase subunit alpha, partial [Candidatus Bathyarchaeia archaeon]
GGCYVATGIEHDERGDPNYEPETHAMMTEKRWRKLQTASGKLKGNHLNATRHGVNDAEIGVLGWGASEGAIFEAVDLANRRGLKVAAMQVKMLSPLPENEIREFIKPLKAVVVPELNYTGHFADLVKKTFLLQPVQLSKVEGVPFTPSEVFSKILEVAESE